MSRGQKTRDFRPRTVVSLEDLVPKDNFYHQVDRCLDLGFIQGLICELYSYIGRPSIDPVVFFKLQASGFRKVDRYTRCDHHCD